MRNDFILLVDGTTGSKRALENDFVLFQDFIGDHSYRVEQVNLGKDFI